MTQKVLFLCQECKSEWMQELNTPALFCKKCGSENIYKSHHHKRAAKKSKPKERWAYIVR